MATVLEPLKVAGNPAGPGVEMTGGDGVVRKVYPLLAAYVADFPEQCLVTCTKYGTCPKCRRKADQLEVTTPGEPRTQRWTHQVIRDARLSAQGRSGPSVYARCMENDVAGGRYEPFWVGFPLLDIHRCIVPDILHQLYQGVLKHLVLWVQEVMGEEELDTRIRALPPAFGVCHFWRGISTLSQVSGAERKHMARILLACLVGKIDPRGIRACRSLLHFINLAQYPSHDQDTLSYMKAELDEWHAHRSYFIDQGPRADFNIPKFHSLLHYIDSICWLGTTDNYNTEMFERMHIDLAKEGWRASNKRDHFPQMINWLSRQEKVASFDYYRSWVESDGLQSDSVSPPEPQLLDTPIEEEEVVDIQLKKLRPRTSGKGIQPTHATIQLAKRPVEPQKSLLRIVLTHGCPEFPTQLKLFLNSLLPLDQQANKSTVLDGSLPFTSLDVWHQYRFTPVALLDDLEMNREIVKAVPVSQSSSKPRFDTVIVLYTDEAESTAIQGRLLHSAL